MTTSTNVGYSVSSLTFYGYTVKPQGGKFYVVEDLYNEETQIGEWGQEANFPPFTSIRKAEQEASRLTREWEARKAATPLN